MKVWGQFLGLASVVLITIGMLPAVFTLAEGASTPSVIINEVAWAGSTKPDRTKVSDDEWIELRNLTDQPVDLSNWQLTKNTGTSDENETRMLTLPANSTIEAEGYFLISRFDIDTSMLNVEPDVVVKRDALGDNGLFSLSNTKLRIGLYQGDCLQIENLVDVAGAIGQAPFAGDSSIKASMERNDIAENGQLLSSWHDAMASVGFDDGVTDLGTPKSANSKLIEPPTIESISPNTAEVGETLQIESIVGTNFDTDSPPTVQLKLNEQTITADNVRTASSTLIDNGQFSLDGAEAGKWDLIVINPDGQTATLPQAVEVVDPPPEYDLTTTVRLNEIYPQPNTTANDEYIELYNFGDKTINLAGWILDDIRDGGSSQFEITTRTILPKTYLTLYKPETKLTLNDNGDSVYLIQPNGFELDRTSYTDAPRGQTWARFDDGWKWTSSPTSNGKNMLSMPAEEVDEPTAVDEPDDPAPSYKAGDILITELLPNPDDTDEFIELYNASTKPINLQDWSLQDKAKHKYQIDKFAVSIQATDALIIQPQQYVIVTDSMSGIALNNTGGESVILIDPAGNVVAKTDYPDKAPIGAAYVLIDGIWTWSKNPTPGRVNILALDEADEAPPAVDIVLPSTLPVTGKSSHRWIGILLISLALSAMVGWRKFWNDCHPE